MLCNVCGDKARSHNYGGISCNSCRSFFQHFVLKNFIIFKNLDSIDGCKFQGNCTIDQVTRRKCTICRFFKCVKIGMEPAWVVSDYERTEKLKQSKLPVSSIPSPVYKLNDEDSAKIANILEYYNTACDLIPYNFPTREKDEKLTVTKLQILLIGSMSISIRRFVCFANMIPEFNRLSLHDQTNLLRRSVTEMDILRNAVLFDVEKRTWNYPIHGSELHPVVHFDEFLSIWPADLLGIGYHIYKRLKSHAPDESSIMLLIVVVLFSDYGGGEACTEFEDSPAINAAQEHYAGLLEKYLKFVHGETKGRLAFPRLLCQLMEITQAGSLHQGAPLNLSDHQVDKMHQHLLELQRVANPSSLQNNETFQDREDFAGEKECCRKRLTGAKPSMTSNNPQPEINNGQGFPSLIHNFVCSPGEWGIKPYFFDDGPSVGSFHAKDAKVGDKSIGFIGRGGVEDVNFL